MHHLKMKDALLFQTETVQFHAPDGYVLFGIRYVPNQTIKAKIIVASPADYGIKEIGHMVYFRKGSEQIWNEIIATFDHLL